MLEYSDAKKFGRCQYCGGFTYKNVELTTPINIVDTGKEYGHETCLPVDIDSDNTNIAVIGNTDELNEFLFDLNNCTALEIRLNDRGLLVQPTFSLEKEKDGTLYLEIRK